MPEDARSILTDSLVILGACDPGSTPQPEELDWMLRGVNRLLDDWKAKYNYFAYATVPYRFPLVIGQSAYAMGPGLVAPDFDMFRPEGTQPGKGIQNCEIALNSGDQEIRYPVRILTPIEWAQLAMPNLPTPWPFAMVVDGSWPDYNINFYGTPTTTCDVVFTVKDQVPEFATLATMFDLPPLWRRALVHNAAVEGATGIRRGDGPIRVPTSVMQQAAQSRADLLAVNTGDFRVGVPLPSSGRDMQGYSDRVGFIGGLWW